MVPKKGITYMSSIQYKHQPNHFLTLFSTFTFLRLFIVSPYIPSIFPLSSTSGTVS